MLIILSSLDTLTFVIDNTASRVLVIIVLYEFISSSLPILDFCVPFSETYVGDYILVIKSNKFEVLGAFNGDNEKLKYTIEEEQGILISFSRILIT